MRRNKPAIPWWIYLALAIVVFVACGAGYEFARQWVDGIEPSGREFGHTFLVNFLGVLRIALPLFLLVLGVLALTAPRRTVATVPVSASATGSRAVADTGPPPVGSPPATAPKTGGSAPDTAPKPARRSKPKFSSLSEAVGVNYGLLRHMEWRRFEIVCAEYLRCLNYEVLETGFGAKDAVDLEVFLPGKGELMSVVKCVADARPVDVDAVRALLDTMKRRRVGEGMLFSVCGFTRRAERFAARHRVALVAGETLCSRIRGLDAETQASMISVATSGDYTTPTCPSCGVKLVLRRPNRSPPGRREFWGCMNFPRCTVTFPLR